MPLLYERDVLLSMIQRGDVEKVSSRNAPAYQVNPGKAGSYNADGGDPARHRLAVRRRASLPVFSGSRWNRRWSSTPQHAKSH
jgi:hypothetical protein